MKKIIAFGASNSKRSINKRFATYATQQLTGVEVSVIDLNDYPLPLYSPDLEREQGIPENARRFDEQLAAADGIVKSLAEYNGNVTTVYKNLFDWLSRIDMKTVWKNVPMLLLAASPGGRGARNALAISKQLLPHFGGNVIADFSLPYFHQHFTEEGIADPALAADLEQAIAAFQNAL